MVGLNFFQRDYMGLIHSRTVSSNTLLSEALSWQFFNGSMKPENDRKEEAHVVVKAPTHVVPFSDEWLAAIEAAGEVYYSLPYTCYILLHLWSFILNILLHLFFFLTWMQSLVFVLWTDEWLPELEMVWMDKVQGI